MQPKNGRMFIRGQGGEKEKRACVPEDMALMRMLAVLAVCVLALGCVSSSRRTGSFREVHNTRLAMWSEGETR